MLEKNSISSLELARANVLGGVLTQLYVEPGQFVLEFLQNAKDALMEARKEGLVGDKEERYFSVELHKDRVVVSTRMLE